MQISTLEEFRNALEELPEEFKEQIAQQFAPSEEQVDSIAIKMELIKFISELHKHNQGVDWETNKIKPKQIKVDQIISDSDKLFKFIIE